MRKDEENQPAKKKKKSDLVRERRASLPQWPEWMEKYGSSHYCGYEVSPWEHYRDGGYLPPRVRDTGRNHRWRRTDLDAWMELRRRDLFGDYKELTQHLGELDAWAVMLKRLEEAKAETLERAVEFLGEVA